jgi:cyclin-A
MSTHAASRRSSSSSAVAKRPAIAEGATKAAGPGPTAAQAKKRTALVNITNVAAPGARVAAVGKVAPPVTGAVRAALPVRDRFVVRLGELL